MKERKKVSKINRNAVMKCSFSRLVCQSLKSGHHACTLVVSATQPTQIQIPATAPSQHLLCVWYGHPSHTLVRCFNTFTFTTNHIFTWHYTKRARRQILKVQRKMETIQWKRNDASRTGNTTFYVTTHYVICANVPHGQDRQ